MPILNRFDIHLGFGERSVETVCKDHELNIDFFLEIVNTFHDASYFPSATFYKSFKSKHVDWISSKTHAYYLDLKIPEIGQYIRQITQEENLQSPHKKLLLDFFNSYQHELTTHINKEEQRVYPYVITLENVLDNPASTIDDLMEISKYSIHEYEEDHDDVEAKLFDLKNIIIKYLPHRKTIGCSMLFTRYFRAGTRPE